MARHPNFSGGAITASHGYKLVYVGKGHHLADIRGYAYEHRIVMEQKLGRKLIKGEIVHHINENKADNSPNNLVLKASNGIHISEHFRRRTDLRPLNGDNPIISCRCGCGEKFRQYDEMNRPRKCLPGHNRTNTGKHTLGIIVSCGCGCGETFNKYDKYGRERKYLPSHNATHVKKLDERKTCVRSSC